MPLAEYQEADSLPVIQSQPSQPALSERGRLHQL